MGNFKGDSRLDDLGIGDSAFLDYDMALLLRLTVLGPFLG